MIRAVVVWLALGAAATAWLMAMALSAGRRALREDLERATGDDDEGS